MISKVLFQNTFKDGSDQSEYLSFSTVSDRKLISSNVNNLKDKHETTFKTSLSSKIHSSQPYQQLNQDNRKKNNLESTETSDEENMIQTLFSKIVPNKLKTGNSSISQPTKTSTGTVSNQTLNSLSGGVLSDDSVGLEDTTGKDLGNLETWSEVSLTSNKTSPNNERHKNEVWTEVNLNDSSSPSSDHFEIQVRLLLFG